MEVPGKRSAGDKDKSAENVDIVCKPCQRENVTTPANGFCKDCDEFMCTICFRQHLKGKLCRHHVLVNSDLYPLSFQGSVERPVSCKQHDGETVKFYCHTHEVVGCGDCIIIKHTKCQPEYIRDLSDNFHQNKEYKSLKENTEKVISERKCFEKEIQDNKKYNKIMLEKAVGDIRQIKLDINEYLDKVESDVVAKIEKIMKENETLLIKIEDECQKLSIKLEEIKAMLNSELFQDNALFIHAVECKPKVSECVMALSDMKSKTMKKYEFVPDKQLLSLSTTDENLGTVAISTMNVCHQTTERANGEGDQPGGSMTVTRKHNGNLGGYYGNGIIAIDYNFPNGKQQENHPNPGRPYRGIFRTAYLPDNEEGRKIAAMLKVAFGRKLVFTIGNSKTTGQEGVITWNDIHHKTDLRPYSQFGYPDPTYLDRVKEELAAKGVTEKDISSSSLVNIIGSVYTDISI